MKRFVMNDYELIYLIHTELDDIALNYIFKKYRRLIWKYVHMLNIDEKEHDDFHQEGMLMLNQAIKTFNPDRNKTFTRYFELILKRHLFRQYQKIPDYVLYDHTDFCKGIVYIEEEAIPLMGSSFEQEVYQAHFIQFESIESLSNRLRCSKKQIYNAIYRIREKMKL